jgi:hypothetical protein
MSTQRRRIDKDRQEWIDTYTHDGRLIGSQAPRRADQDSIEQKVNALRDLAMTHVDSGYHRADRLRVRREIEDAIEALIDDCRTYYRGEKDGQA